MPMKQVHVSEEERHKNRLELKDFLRSIAIVQANKLLNRYPHLMDEAQHECFNRLPSRKLITLYRRLYRKWDLSSLYIFSYSTTQTCITTISWPTFTSILPFFGRSFTICLCLMLSAMSGVDNTLERDSPDEQGGFCRRVYDGWLTTRWKRTTPAKFCRRMQM